MTTNPFSVLAEPLANLGHKVLLVNEANGWDQPLNTPVEQIALCSLIMTEGAEAIEEIRDGHLENRYTIDGHEVEFTQTPRPAYIDADGDRYDWRRTPKPEGLPSELADVIIRTVDFAARMGIDLDHAVDEKLKYNATRGQRHGGKAL